MTRTMVVWCPDWPVRAAIQSVGLPVDAPVAVFDSGQVFACSGSARAEGVRRGLRRRDAQSRCPDLIVLERDENQSVRVFEPVLAAIEEISPGVQLMRPGACAVRVKGPKRYYGGEPQAAAVVAERIVDSGVDDCRIGVADGPFAAEQAARQAAVQDSRIVAEGGSAQFLADLPVDVLGQPELVGLLRRLGLRTLGDFAALPSADVVARFGEPGALAHRLAAGRDVRSVAARRPSPELERSADFEPPLERVDAVAFSIRRTAEDFVASLAKQGLVCTSVWIDVRTDAGEVSSREWLHPRWFDPVDLVDRVRWQLQGGASGGSGLGAPVVSVALVPEEVEPIANHAEGLWGSGPDERIHRAMSRVQSMLGHEAVVSPVIGGGRHPADRQVLVPWGDQLQSRSPRGAKSAREAMPWPGALPSPAPATVFTAPLEAVVVGAGGRSIGVTKRGAVSEEPMRFGVEGAVMQPVQAWAGPWPVDERWWDPKRTRGATRFQVVGVDGSAWLLVVEEKRWWAEARYD